LYQDTYHDTCIIDTPQHCPYGNSGYQSRDRFQRERLGPKVILTMGTVFPGTQLIQANQL